MSDAYVQSVLDRHRVATGPLSPAEQAVNAIAPYLRQWAGSDLSDIFLSGSYAKGTAVHGSADVDVFLSLRSTLTLKDIYESLFRLAATNGWNPRRQNVSIGVAIGQVKVDLVPGRVQAGYQNFHSLYKSKQDSWTQTNVSQQNSLVRNSGRTEEIRALKIWRNRLGLDFPSFYLELLTIEALKWSRDGLADNVLRVFRFIDTDLARTRFIDPSNSANIISDDLTAQEKAMVLVRAREALAARTWNEILG
jgi:Nucleotidyltransferase domain